MQPHSFQAPHQPALKPRWQWPWATQPCSHNAAEGDSRALFSQLCFLSGPILSGVFYSSPEAKNVFVENNAGDRKVPPDAACHASTPQLTTRAGIPPPSSMFKLPFLLRTSPAAIQGHCHTGGGTLHGQARLSDKQEGIQRKSVPLNVMNGPRNQKQEQTSLLPCNEALSVFAITQS